MTNEERIKALFNSTPEQLAAIDAALAGEPSPADPPSLKLYRMSEAAKVTGRSRCSLWRAAKEGKIRTVQLRANGCRLIPETELRKLAGVN